MAWEPIGQSLAQLGFCVFAIDQRGHGLSGHVPRHSQYHFVDYVADVEAWLFENALSSVHLIGHSMGGTVASLVAASGSAQIASLLMIEGLGAPHDSPEQSSLRYIQHLRQRRRQAHGKRFKTPDDAISRFQAIHSALSPLRAKKLVDRILVPCDDEWTWRWDPRHKDRSAASMPNERYCQLLSEIKAPAAFISGEKSTYTSLFSLEQRLGSIATLQKRYSVPGGHNLHYDSPAELTSSIYRWLMSIT